MAINGWSVRITFLAGVVFLVIAGASYARDPKPGFSKATIANAAFDIVPNATGPTGQLAHGLLDGLNGSVIEVYDDATLVEIHGNDQSELKARGRAKSVAVTLRDDMDKISLNGRVIDARDGIGAVPPGETPDPPYQGDEQGTWLIQFVGPIKDAWLDEIRAGGIVMVQYVPTHAYVVGGRHSAIAPLKSRSYVQWTSQLHRFLRPSVGPRAPGTIELWIQLAQTDETENAVAELSALSVGPVKTAPWSASELRLHGVFHTNDLDVILAQPLVWSIDERPAIDFSDERATLGVTNMIPGAGQVAGRYRKWLADLCPTCTNLADDGFHIGIADTGLDGGSHPSSGLLGGEAAATGQLRDEFLPAERIRWGASFAPTPTTVPPGFNWNCRDSCPDTTESKHDTYGHGTMVAGVAAGNPPANGSTDSAGFLWGLGVAPSAGLVITKVVPGRMVANETPITPVDQVTSDARREGRVDPNDPTKYLEPAYWQNFSMNQYYDTDAPPHCATMYDGLYSTLSRDFDAAVRDADLSTPAAEPITLTIASGNMDRQLSATTTNCSWMKASPLTLPPATAKNVTAVGGGENVRPDPWLCSGARADDYSNLSFNAKRGTAVTGWHKPDLIAVSSNVSSLRTSDSVFPPRFCGQNDPGPGPPYLVGSGTSFAAPIGVAAAALASRRFNANPAAAKPSLVKAMLIAGAKSMAGGKDRVTLGFWKPIAYAIGDRVHPVNPNGRYYEVLSIENSNAPRDLNEPQWPTQTGATVYHQISDLSKIKWIDRGPEPQIPAFPNGQQGFGRIYLGDVLSEYPARVYLNEQPLPAMSS